MSTWASWGFAKSPGSWPSNATSGRAGLAIAKCTDSLTAAAPSADASRLCVICMALCYGGSGFALLLRFVTAVLHCISSHGYVHSAVSG